MEKWIRDGRNQRGKLNGSVYGQASIEWIEWEKRLGKRLKGGKSEVNER